MDVDEISGLTVELFAPWIPQRGHVGHLRICVKLYQNLVRWPMILICKLSIGARSLVMVDVFIFVHTLYVRLNGSGSDETSRMCRFACIFHDSSLVQ